MCANFGSPKPTTPERSPFTSTTITALQRRLGLWSAISETDPGKEWTSQWHWSDREIGLEGKRLEPGKETSYQKPIRPNPLGRAPSDSADLCENFQVVAAIFADGTVSGDFTWINAILAERQKLYQDIAKANEILTKAIVEGADTEAALKQISEWQQSEGLPARPGRASANYGESSGWRSRPVTEGLQPKSNFMPPRPFARAAAAGVTIGLIQEKKHSRKPARCLPIGALD